jgi:exopolysaccharide biosynthesis polyprenyl glycosylphosphotransferase
VRRSDFIYTAILVPLDYLMLILAGLVSYNLRTSQFVQGLDIISDVFYQLPRETYLFFLLAVAVVWLLFFKIAGLYHAQENKKFINQIIKVFLACTAGISAVIIFLFFKREFLFSSRFIVLAGWVLSIILIIIGRGMVRVLRRVLLKYYITAKPIIVVGSDANTNRFIKQIKKQTQWGYKIIGKALTIDQLAQKVKTNEVQEVILTDLNYSRDKVNNFLEFCQTHHLNFKYAADIFSAHLHNIEIDAIAGFPLIEIKRTPLEGWGRLKKRLMDIVISSLALTVALIPGLIIALLIKLTSQGPVFVKLIRVGEQGQLFKIYKFRSMVRGAHKLKKRLLKQSERTGPLFKMRADPRVTKLGRILRRFSLDEIPNFYNVLIGNMSLVGPRPHEPEEVELYKEYQKKLLNIKPGITGMAQISGRSNLNFDEETRLDLYYIENWSLKMDIAILLKTPFAVLFRREGAV